MRTPRHLGANIALGAMILMILLGIVVVAMPLRCTLGLLGSGACLAHANVPANPAKSVASAASHSPAAAQPVVRVASTPVPPAAPSPAPAPAPAVAPAAPVAAADLVAATFDSLQAPPVQAIVAADSGANAADQGELKAGAPPVLADAAPVTPATRTVSTTVIRASDASDYAPEVALAQRATTALASISTDPAAPVATVSAPIPASKPVAKLASLGPAAVKATPTSLGSMVVGRTGVTVRSGPSRSGAQLFNLAAGQRVTVQGSEHGWVHIVDAQGRAGWVYSTYIARIN